MIRASLFALATALPLAVLAAGPEADDRKAAKPKACDTTKIHTGPRGGRYRYTASCKKVYIKR